MQAIIMTAYKNPQGTMELLRCLAPKMPCYVHVDAGGEITDEETAQMNRIEGVHAWKKYRVNWGSIRHLEALCFLMKEALCDKNKAKKNIAVDVAFNMAADDFLYDLEPGNLNASEYDLDDLDILDVFSEKIQEQIFICVGAEPKDPDICLSDAIDKLYEEGNLHQITEYITSMISDVDELVSLI